MKFQRREPTDIGEPFGGSIQLKSDGRVFDGLRIDEVYPGSRDKRQVLTDEGGIQFRTSANRGWFLRFSEFSFVMRKLQPRESRHKQSGAVPLPVVQMPVDVAA